MAERMESGFSQSHGKNGSCCRKCSCFEVRNVGSKGATLVIVWMYLVSTSLTGSMYFGSHTDLSTASKRISQASIIGGVILVLLGPLTGLVASAYIGRYKTIYASFCCMWLGNLAMTAISAMTGLFQEVHWTMAYCGNIFAEVTYFVGFTAFAVICVPFGLDQMPDASSEQITAFIHWCVWSMFAGVATAYQLSQLIYSCKMLHVPTITITGSFTSAVALTLALGSIFLLRKVQWLIIEPEANNPLKNIVSVLKFALRHKVPVRRSAFTYWEPGIPSRIDLGKSKYGGPFTNEEVEDVKTSLRMLAVIAVTIIPLSTFTICAITMHPALHIMLKTHQQYCHVRTIDSVMTLVLSAVFTLPIFDFTIRPAIRKCFPSIMKSVGLAQGLIICFSLILLVTSVVWYVSKSSSQCFLMSIDNTSPLSVNYLWIQVPACSLAAFCSFLVLTTMLEFVCAQAPYNSKSILVALMLSLALLSAFLAAVIFGVWTITYQHKGSGIFNCGIWFYLFTTVTAILGCVLWCVMAKWYKNREREEVDMCRIFAENYYDH